MSAVEYAIRRGFAFATRGDVIQPALALQREPTGRDLTAAEHILRYLVPFRGFSTYVFSVGNWWIIAPRRNMWFYISLHAYADVSRCTLIDRYYCGMFTVESREVDILIYRTPYETEPVETLTTRLYIPDRAVSRPHYDDSHYY